MIIKSLVIPQNQIKPILELFSSGLTQEALDSVEALIKEYPNESLLFNISGACYAGLGQFDAAVRDYEKAIAIKPDYSKAHFNLGVTLQELDQLNGAVESYEKALVIEPDYAEAHNNLAITLKDIGQLDAAVKSFKKAIAIKPDYVEAHYSLGNMLHELGQLDDAVKSYKEVVNIEPDFTEIHNNLGVILNKLNQNDAALKSFERAVAIKPDFAEAHNNLGNVLKELGQLDRAIKFYEKAIAIKADYAEAHFNLGDTLRELGQLDTAVKKYEKAIAIKPDYAEAHFNLGFSLQKLGQLDEAVKCFKKAIAIKPDFAEPHNNLGISLQKLGQPNEAVKCFEKAIAIKPDYAEAYNNLGISLQELGQSDEAVKCYEKAIAIKADFAEPHNNLGITFKELGQPDEAVKSYQMAIAIKPNYAEAHNNQGIALRELDQLDAAINCYEKAISNNPDLAVAYSNLADLLTDLKRFDEALVCFERAIDLKPNENFTLGHFLHTKMHLCIWNDLENFLKELTIKINNSKKVIDPFHLLALIDDPELHSKTAKTYIHDKYPKNYDISKINHYPKHKKIRIGYFSADFREHPVGNLTAELYEIHDRSQFEIHAFSFGPDTNDEMNLRIKAGVDYFHDVHTKSHKEIVMLSRSFEIDIALDLGGFTQHSRTGIFTMQAAPIQVNYLGYAGTMGAEFIDYIIADRTLIPKDKQNHYSEKIAYLPDSFMVNDTKNKISTREFTREGSGLPNDGFVFCCFNNHFKITPSVFTSWMRILSQVDGSVLWLAEGNSIAANNLKKEAEKNGVERDRLIFAPRLGLREDHLKRIQLADIFLDTLPYNAHATTSDALQVGLPVLTCIGNSFASRVAASLINSVDLPELITTNQEQYESLAIQLAINPEKLKIIKDKLGNHLPSSPLYDTPLFAKYLEAAYLKMYKRYEQRLEPDHIYVE